MIEYRKARPEEWEDVLDFANLVFSAAHCPHDFARLIPKVYGHDVNAEEMVDFHYLAVRDGKIRAMTACPIIDLSYCGEPLKVGLVGTVSVHPYSRREGTPAAKMPGQHPNAIKESRAAAAAAVASELENEYNEAMIGKSFPVLFEQEEHGHFTGHAPNYVKVYVKEKDLHNEIKTIRITALYRDGVLGVLEETK